MSKQNPHQTIRFFCFEMTLIGYVQFRRFCLLWHHFYVSVSLRSWWNFVHDAAKSFPWPVPFLRGGPGKSWRGNWWGRGIQLALRSQKNHSLASPTGYAGYVSVLCYKRGKWRDVYLQLRVRKCVSEGHLVVCFSWFRIRISNLKYAFLRTMHGQT